MLVYIYVFIHYVAIYVFIHYVALIFMCLFIMLIFMCLFIMLLFMCLFIMLLFMCLFIMLCLFLFLLNRLSPSTLSKSKIKEDFVMLFGFSLKEDEPIYKSSFVYELQ